MTYCKECGHKLGFLEHADDGLCNGCRQRQAQERAAEARARFLAPYTSGTLPVVTVSGAIMKKGETAHFATSTILKEIRTVSLGYSGGSHGVSIPLPIKIGGAPIRYRVGQSRGHVVKHDELRETSRGQTSSLTKRTRAGVAIGHTAAPYGF